MKQSESAARIAIGIGANLGDAKAAVAQAIKSIATDASFSNVVHSDIFRSAPIDASGPDYCNAVALASTELSPMQVLSTLQEMELRGGRERPYRNAPRTLDLDLLLYDELQMQTATLTLPHPRMHLRAFVLVPLAQIAPDIAIPGHGPVAELLQTVSDQTIAVQQ